MDSYGEEVRVSQNEVLCTWELERAPRPRKRLHEAKAGARRWSSGLVLVERSGKAHANISKIYTNTKLLVNERQRLMVSLYPPPSRPNPPQRLHHPPRSLPRCHSNLVPSL